MRVKIKEPAEFFDGILKNKSLKSFSTTINVNYSTLKKWRCGDSLIPENQFNKLLTYTKNKKYWLKNTSFKNEGWGCSKGGKIAVSKLSKDELTKRLAKARSHIKRRTKKLKLIMSENLCEFYGILMGDGCLSKSKRNKGSFRSKVIISGHKYLDKEYHEEYIKNLVKNEFKLNSYIYCSKKYNIRSLIISNKSFFESLIKLGFPVGKKGQKLKIPNRLLKLSWDTKKHLIRGIFDTDGCIVARKDEGYKYPCIIITSHSKILIQQMYKLLRNKKYPFWITKNKSEIRMRGSKNVTRWMSDIGSSNLKHKHKYKYWLEHKMLPANLKNVKDTNNLNFGPVD